jgi:hypothetical protein
MDIALLVPFREDPDGARGPQLTAFLKHFGECSLHSKSETKLHVFVVEQSDDGNRFNKGQLLNAGFEQACKQMKEKGCTNVSYIFHGTACHPLAHLIVCPLTHLSIIQMLTCCQAKM